MTNKIKGDSYEYYILNNLSCSNAWLWKHIPEKILINCGFFEDQYEYLKLKEKSKNKNINFLIDTGIDIIEENNGEYIGIQCKNGYSNGLSINDLGTFYFMLYNFQKIKSGKIYYTNRINHLVTKLSNNPKVEFIKKVMITEDSISSEEIHKKYELYDYQIEAVNKIKNYYENNYRGILSLVCGGGKTLVASTYAINYNKIIFISPLKQFAEQNLERFKSYYNNYKCLLVDSDGTRNEKEIIDVINNNQKVFISVTYKSIDVLANISNNFTSLLHDCFVIFDEFHNISINNLINNEDPINILLNSELKILFLSATPRIYELENNEDEDNYNNLLGETIYNMSINEAINRKIICNYKIYIPSVSLIASNENIKNDINSKINIQDLNNEYVAKSIYLYKCITFHGSRKTIIYCKDTEDLKNLMNTINILKKYYEMDDILLDKITHKTSNKKRQEIIKEFSESETYSLLFSVQILDECIDIPSCDSIFISYHSNSKIRSIQRINRATRINKMNPYKIANIYLWCDNYSNILECLSNLKEYDTDLSTKVFIQDSQLKKLNNNQNELIIKDQAKINNYIISVKEYKTLSWDDKLEKVKQYMTINKIRPSSKDLNKEIKNLGSWLSYQTYNYNNKKEIMKNTIIYNLWTKFITEYKEYFIDKNEEWEVNLVNACRYIDENNKLPSSTDKNLKIKSLGCWIGRQKQNLKNNILTENQIEKWNGFIDTYSEYLLSNEENWNIMFIKCKKFIDENKRRPSKVIESEKQLNNWLKTQVHQYKLKTKIMKNKEIEKTWDNLVNSNDYKEYFNCDYDEEWFEKFNQLVSYYKENKTYPLYSTTLGAWYKKQVYKYNNKVNIMTNEKIYKTWEKFMENPLK
jgi:superfamily II DNA or RNA helicase